MKIFIPKGPLKYLFLDFDLKQPYNIAVMIVLPSECPVYASFMLLRMHLKSMSTTVPPALFSKLCA